MGVNHYAHKIRIFMPIKKETVADKLKKATADVRRLTTLSEAKSESISKLEEKVKAQNETINELTLQLTDEKKQENVALTIIKAVERLEASIRGKFDKSVTDELNKAVETGRNRELTNNNLMLYGASEGVSNAILAIKGALKK